ncbi:MAG TPA: protein kinase [Bryobacteraceae bacterium]|jgi:serine/threonine protein kinase|nr:protein kinase [Bryobacteraceae bacterium]
MDPKVFGRYQIVRKLAGGGMGRVFLAYDPVLNRHVGLKLIDAGGDPDSIDVITAERRGAMLQDQLAKREQGGRVAQIFDVGEREGYFFIAMEYIEGEDLSELVARGPLDPQHAVSISLDILDVLVKAHTFQSNIEGREHRGIIHGDIKPRNIRITPTGHVKVLDFGIAKAVSMTRSITFNQFGSIPYSSPERLQTGDMDARSDVWSVAIVLFEMLTGKPYFEALASSKLEWMIRNYQALEPSIASLPGGLREILSRALNPELTHRFASAATFQAALHEWTTYGKSVADPSSDPDATRRSDWLHQTPAPEPETGERTRRAVPPPTPVSAPAPQAAPPAPARPVHAAVTSRSHFRRLVFRTAVAVSVTLFFFSVFSVVYEIRMFENGEALRKQIDSARITPDDARTAFYGLAKKSMFSFPLHWARLSLRDRYAADTDRVIADYREASESTPVTLKDWQRAQSAVNSALALTPDDKSLRGKLALIDGHLKMRAANQRAADQSNALRDARSNFEEAQKLLPHSPDPHLGLALVYMRMADLDHAQNELNEARRNGFQPGLREQKLLADGYKLRGERWLTSAHRAHEIGPMQDSLRRAVSDFAHAQELYNSVAPFQNGVELADRVSTERDRAARSLAQAEQAQAVSATPAP